MMRRWIRALIILAGLTSVAVIPAAQRSGASPALATPNENFIVRVYNDLLLADPSPEDISQGLTSLATQSRTGYVEDLLYGYEFSVQWVAGATGYYMGYVDTEDPDFDARVLQVESNHNFVTSEVSILADPAYFAQVGSTNQDFVASLYSKILLRAPDQSGLNYWTGRLNAQTSTRSSVASYFIRSSEASRRRVAGPASATQCSATVLTDDASLAAGSYCIILDRMADPSGSTYWTNQLASSGQLPDLWKSLAGSNEFYNLAQT